MIGTVAKAACLLAVTTAISQLKWLWFRREKQEKGRLLTDLELFDSASRGPWGALVLMVKLKGWYAIRFAITLPCDILLSSLFIGNSELTCCRRSIVFLGTGVLIVAMFFEFAIQQSIRTGVRTSFVPSNTAQILRLRDYNRSKCKASFLPYI